MEQIEEYRKIIKDKIAEISNKKIDKLTDIWMELFEPSICKDHMQKLTDHADAFYCDIVQETVKRKKAIQENIKQLGEEKNDLKRLLKEDVTDVSTCGLPLYTLQVQIDESLKSLREKLECRRAQIDEYMLECDQLCEELAEEKRELKEDPLPSEEEMIEFRAYLNALNEEKFHRLDEISNMRKNIKVLLQYLEIHLLEEYDDNLINGRCLQPTNENISKLRMLHEQFAQQFDEMKNQISTKRKKIDMLWNYLSIPESYREKFGKYTECTQTTYSILSQELDRCEQIKRDNIKIFIDKVREQIQVYWDKCLKSEQERARFTNFYSNTFTEDLLALHEMELEELTIFYEDNLEIFNLLKERQDLLDRMEMLEQKANDPNRYNNRGGGLLKEEKERRTINASLPKVEAKLLEFVQNYNSSHRHPFTVFGEPVQVIIDREWEKRKQDKITKSGKKLIATPARTPGRSTTLRTPASGLSALKTSTVKNMTGVRKQLVLPSSSTSKMSATSSTVSSAASIHTSTGKRRLGTPAAANPSTKRALINQFKSPAPRMQTPRTVGNKLLASTRSPLAPHNFGQNLKISSKSRKSMDKAKRRLSSKKMAKEMKRKNIPEIVCSDTSDRTVHDSVSYDMIENYFAENHSQRSSIIQKSSKPRLMANHHGYGSPLYKKASTSRPPRVAGTPSKQRSPPHHLRSPSPSASNMSRINRLKSKELPFML